MNGMVMVDCINRVFSSWLQRSNRFVLNHFAGVPVGDFTNGTVNSRSNAFRKFVCSMYGFKLFSFGDKATQAFAVLPERDKIIFHSRFAVVCFPARHHVGQRVRRSIPHFPIIGRRPRCKLNRPHASWRIAFPQLRGIARPVSA